MLQLGRASCAIGAHHTLPNELMRWVSLQAVPRQGLEKLTSLIFAKALPKQLGRQVLTGSVLAALTSAYVDAINGGAVPTITTAWQVGGAR